MNLDANLTISKLESHCQPCQSLSWLDYRDYVFNEAIQKYDLKPIESLMLLYLLKCADENGRCYPSLKTLSRKLNVNRKTIQRALKRLEKSGLIKKRIMELGNRKVKLAFQLLRDGMPVAFISQDRGQKVPGVGVKKCLGTKPYELSQNFKEESAKGNENLFKSAGYGAGEMKAQVAQLVANPGNGQSQKDIDQVQKEIIRELFNRPIVKPLRIREKDLIKPSDYPVNNRKTIDWDKWDTSQSTFNGVLSQCFEGLIEPVYSESIDGKKKYPWESLGTGESAFKALEEHWKSMIESEK